MGGSSANQTSPSLLMNEQELTAQLNAAKLNRQKRESDVLSRMFTDPKKTPIPTLGKESLLG